MKIKIAGCLAAAFVLAGAAALVIRSLKRLEHMFDGMTTMECDDIII